MIPNFDHSGNLPPGLIRSTVQEFEDHFVSSFSQSYTRSNIFVNYKRYREKVISLAVATKQWVNGSYTTNKENPNDIDLVTHFDAMKVNNENTNELINPLDNKFIKMQYQCDVYGIFVYPKSIPDKHEFYLKQIRYWSYWFGHDRNKNPKGIIEFDLNSNFLIKDEEYMGANG